MKEYTNFSEEFNKLGGERQAIIKEVAAQNRTFLMKSAFIEFSSLRKLKCLVLLLLYS